MNVHIMNRVDPLAKQAERGKDGQGLSPMDPPDAYAPPSLDPVPLAELHPYLRGLLDGHAPLVEEINAFEAAIVSIQKTGYTKESNASLMRFFHFFDREFAHRSRREEEALFPLLHRRLLACGEHGKGDTPRTAADVMKDEHAEAAQLAAVAVNFLGLAHRLPEERSRLIVLDAALEQCKNLVELLRLLVFRKGNVLYALAQRLISAEEFDRMQSVTAGPGEAN